MKKQQDEIVGKSSYGERWLRIWVGTPEKIAKVEELKMGLFSKPSEDKVVELFNGLSDTEKESVKQKLFGTPSAEETKATEDVASEDVALDDSQVAYTDIVIDNSTDESVAETTESEKDSKETFEEMFKRLIEEQNKKIDSLNDSFNQKIEEITNAKAKEEINTEKKPFGLAEQGKEYKANSKPKETSKEMIKRIFGGNG